MFTDSETAIPSEARTITLLRSLRGCPCTVIFALALFGRKMTNQDLQLATGYTDKPITAALTLLTLHGMVVDTGKGGWTLSDGMKQLPLFPEALLDPESVPNGPKIIPGEARRSEYFRSSSLSSSSRSITYGSREEEEERTKALDDRRNSDHHRQPVDNPVDNSRSESVASLLIRAGIGRSSPKLREILATKPDLNYVKAHVLYFEHWRQERARHPGQAIDGRKRFTVGTLITRLLERDPAPPMRCEDCGRLESNCLCNIIRS